MTSNAAFLALLGLDALAHASLLAWYVRETHGFGSLGDDLARYKLSRTAADLLVIFFPARLLTVAGAAFYARRSKNLYWRHRAQLRARLFWPKIAILVAWASSASYALVKGLSRVVENGKVDPDRDERDDASVTLFTTLVGCSMLFSFLNGHTARARLVEGFEEAQKARRVYRKIRRMEATKLRAESNSCPPQRDGMNGMGEVESGSALVASVGTPLLGRYSRRRRRGGSSSSLLTPSMIESPLTYLRSHPEVLARGSDDDGAPNSAVVSPEIPNSTTTTTTTTYSDHESDDDSTSEGERERDDENSSDDDDDDAVDNERKANRRFPNDDKNRACAALRAAERRRRIRERRRKHKEEKEQKLDTGASVRELLAYNRPDAPILLLAFICLVVAAVSGAFIPRYTGQVINHVSDATPDRDAFKRSIYLLTLSAVTCGVFSGLRGCFFTIAMARMNVRLRRALFRRLLNQEQGFFDSIKIGEISSRLNNNTTTVSDQVALNMNVLLRSLVEGGIVLVLMFRLSWRLSLLSFAAIPLMTLISKVYGDFYRRLANLANDALADTSGIAEEALAAVGTVRDFGARKAERRVYGEELTVFYNLNVREALAYSAFAFTWTAIPALVTALTLWEGGTLVLDRDKSTPCGQDGTLCSGDLVSFMLYSQSLSGNVESVGSIFSGIAGALGAADKIFDLLKRRPKIAVLGDDDEVDEDDPGEIEELTRARAEFDGSIEFTDVTFRYPSRPNLPVLSHFSLRVNSGEMVALVGASGGGKSSAIRLLLHHYEPEAGRVCVGGREVGTYPQRVLHRLVSVVSQEPTLFARSVLRNILYGLEGAVDEPDLERVVRAAKLANAHEFISRLPKGYATMLGERGATLSGGQKQRLAIARALVRDPRVLLLDESTSALDSETEAKVLGALEGVFRSLTVLVVAHRLSSIKSADAIAVLEKGVVAELGTHDELLRKPEGKYAELVRRQLNAGVGGT